MALERLMLYVGIWVWLVGCASFHVEKYDIYMKESKVICIQSQPTVFMCFEEKVAIRQRRQDGY